MTRVGSCHVDHRSNFSPSTWEEAKTFVAALHPALWLLFLVAHWDGGSNTTSACPTNTETKRETEMLKKRGSLLPL
jgi:hypothetical protein